MATERCRSSGVSSLREFKNMDCMEDMAKLRIEGQGGKNDGR